MCWGIPAKIVKIQDNLGTVAISGLRKQVSLDLITRPHVGEYVLVHAGFAIQKVNEKNAHLTLDFFKGKLEHA